MQIFLNLTITYIAVEPIIGRQPSEAGTANSQLWKIVFDKSDTEMLVQMLI